MPTSQILLGTTLSSGAPPGESVYNDNGNYSFTVPAGVSSISVYLCGGGGHGPNDMGGQGSAGGGAAIAYVNNIAVSGGDVFTVIVGAGGTGGSSSPGEYSRFQGSSGTYGSSDFIQAGRGGTGGYSPSPSHPTDRTNSEGYGAFVGTAANPGSPAKYYGYAQTKGNTGTSGVACGSTPMTGVGNYFGGPGGGGTSYDSDLSGQDGSYGAAHGGHGGVMGGGGGPGNAQDGGQGAKGGLRVIWPGDVYSFPNTAPDNLGS